LPVENPINRHSIGDRTPDLRKSVEEPLEFYLPQHQHPDWLDQILQFYGPLDGDQPLKGAKP
jgi:hypothetical protein